MSKSASFLKNLLVCIAAIIVALLLAEGVLRLVLPSQRRINHRDFYEPNPLLGWQKKPGATRHIRTTEFSATETTNSRGLRGEEYPYEKTQGEFRILILGDSFAEGYTVNNDDLFSEILKKTLNHRGESRRYQVINAGTVGYGTDQELLFFETEGKKYSPDLVLLLFYENDVLENVSITEMYSKYKPVFRIVGDQLILGESPAAASQDRARLADASNPQSFLSSQFRKLLLYRLVQEQMSHLGIFNIKDEVSNDDIRYFGVLAVHDTPEIEYAWKLTARLLERLNDSVSASGAKLMVFYAPSVYALDADVWSDTSRRFRLENGKWDLLKPELRLGKLCDSLGIPFRSLGAAFRQRAQELRVKPSFFYYIGDGHWNTHGHKEAARTIYESLESRYFSESGKNAMRRGLF